jgi:hypothetical protein
VKAAGNPGERWTQSGPVTVGHIGETGSGLQRLAGGQTP